LTYRATEPAVNATAERWDTPARDVRVMINGLARLGYDTGSLLTPAGISIAGLDDPDAMLPCESVGRLLTGAPKQRSTPNLGLRLAQVTPLGSYPLLDYLILTSDTVGAGVHQLTRYFRITGSPVTITVHADQEPIRVDMMGAASP